MKKYLLKNLAVVALLTVAYSPLAMARVGLIDWQPYTNGPHYLIPQTEKPNGQMESPAEAIRNYVHSIENEPELSKFAVFNIDRSRASIVNPKNVPRAILLIANSPEDHLPNPIRIRNTLESFNANRLLKPTFVLPVGAIYRLTETQTFEFFQNYYRFVYLLHLMGGPDLAPEVRGKEDGIASPYLQHGSVNSLRDQLERKIIEHFISFGFGSIFATCRGHQFLNVILNGSLFEDIPTDAPHAIEHMHTAHGIILKSTKNRILQVLTRGVVTGLLDPDIVQSNHHMGVLTSSPYLEIAAISEDGLIEATEGLLPKRPSDREADRVRFLLSTQFHAEYPTAKGKFGRQLLFRAAEYALALFKPPTEIELPSHETEFKGAADKNPYLDKSKHPDCIRALLHQSEQIRL